MKLCVVIPVYNSQGIVYKVIEDVLNCTEYPIFIIDDGSDPEVNLPKDEKRLFLHRFPVNQGKGRALTWAIKNLSSNYTHLVTMDGDGQHLAQDIEKLVSVATHSPTSFVLGARKFRDNVPGISRFGRSFSNFWVWYQTGVRVSDSQSGFRIYPLEKLKEMSFFTRRYDFEIEVLVRGIWNHITVKEVDIEVIYPKKDERVTHFNKVYDNVRITFLNMLLILYSLFFNQKGFRKILLTSVWGVLVYFVSDWVLSSTLFFLGAFLLRLNVPILIIVILVLSFF